MPLDLRTLLPDWLQPRDADAVSSDADTFPAKETSSRVDRVIAIGLSVFFLFVYALTSSFWAFPGESARLTSIIVGAYPAPAPQDLLVIHGFRLLSSLAGSVGGARACASLSVLISAVSVGIAYLLFSALFRFIINQDIMDALVRDGRRQAERSAVFGGLIAALAQGFAVPFWVASSRVNAYAPYLLTLLFCGLGFVRYLATDRVRPLLASMALYGLLCSQSPTALQFLPVFLVGLFFGFFRSSRGPAVSLLAPGAAFAAAFLVGMAAVILLFQDSEGYRMLRYYGPSKVMENALQYLLSGIVSPFSRVGWMIFLGTVTLPWLCWLGIGHRSLNGEGGPAMGALHIAMLASTLLVLLNSRYAPWSMFGFLPEQVFSYTLAASTFAYCCVSARQHILFAFFPTNYRPTEEEDEEDDDLAERPVSMPAPAAAVATAADPATDPADPATDEPDRVRTWFGAALRVLVTLGALLLVRAEISGGYPEANARATRFIRQYVDRVLDDLHGRTLLMTDGLFDDMFRLRARERKVPLTVVSLTEAQTVMGRRLLKDHLHNATLRNALDLGVFSFLQEYIESDPSAGSDLALTFFPDLWNVGPYRAYPDGLLFLGASDAAGVDRSDPYGTGADHLGANKTRYFLFLERIQTSLARVPQTATPFLRFLADSVRRRVGFIGNNLGYYMETEGRREEALALYRAVHAFDPGNVSAMLNLFAALRADKESDPVEVETVRAEIEAFHEHNRRPIQIWELSRSQGYVSSPEAFAFLGWSWAMSGQTPIALRTLDSALKDYSGKGRQTAMLLALGNIHARRGDTTESATYYKGILETDPENIPARIGLLHAELALGEVAAARTDLDRLLAQGVPAADLLQEETDLLIVSGSLDEARKNLRRILVESPESTVATFALFTIDASEYASLGEGEDARREELLRSMLSLASKLRDNPETRTFQGAIAMGAYHAIRHDWTDARNEFRIANKTVPGVPAVLEQILRLDYGLNDRLEARDHARELLRINPRHGLANYILGSLALSAGAWDSAHAYLARAEAVWDGPLPKGDLAYASLNLGEYERALSLSEAALRQNDRIAEIWDTKGLVLIALRRPDEAVEAFRMALHLLPNAHVFHLHLARAYLDAGKRELAQATLNELENVQQRFSGIDRRFYDELWSDLHNPKK